MKKNLTKNLRCLLDLRARNTVKALSRADLVLNGGFVFAQTRPDIIYSRLKILLVHLPTVRAALNDVINSH
jgi:hypothetical protein